MKTEVGTAVRFISRVVNCNNKLDKEQVEGFSKSLIRILCERYTGHWYPENPTKGQAFRCIRINRQYAVDESILKACEECGINYADLALPREITVWIDPGDIGCRFGEDNHHFTVKDEEDSNTGKATPEPETSDYHSASPTESLLSSEDEGTVKPLAASAASLAAAASSTALWAAASSRNKPMANNTTQQGSHLYRAPSPLWIPHLRAYVQVGCVPLNVYVLPAPAPLVPAPRRPNPNLVRRLTRRAPKP
ncbi:protein BTG3-like [Rhineura floridana]|uniref:protein BTG3-like n=1 Tax=Rhineura floridana TaxID=261503 RepID=UPI002AC7FBB7|nr:protein BTG3-like [Rhineura floridana]XP_061452651.1 protein BTG3-like [Rhineura floridana]XP_061452652.1 protein BTG3-like [Rhineura floridana]